MKNCSNCGTELTDDSLFCSNCGSKQDEPVINTNPQSFPQAQSYIQVQPYQNQPQPYSRQPYANQQQSYNGQPYAQPVYGNPVSAPQKSKAPLIIAIIAGVVGALAIVILLAVLLFPKLNIGSKSYESAFDNFCQAVNTQDINKLYKCLPPASATAIKGMIALGGMNEDQLFADLFGSMGDNVRVDYRIIDATPLDSYELSYYQDFFSGGLVSEGYYVEVALTITIDGYTEEEYDEMTVVKIGNRWCFADFMF